MKAAYTSPDPYILAAELIALTIPQLIDLANERPDLRPQISESKNWACLYSQEFVNTFSEISFETFSKQWRKLFVLDLKYPGILELERTKVESPIDKLTQVLFRDIYQQIYWGSYETPLHISLAEFEGGNNCAWAGDKLWYISPQYELQHLNIGASIEAAYCNFTEIFIALSGYGILRFQNAKKVDSDQFTIVCNFYRPIKEMAHTDEGLVFLTVDRELYNTNGVLLASGIDRVWGVDGKWIALTEGRVFGSFSKTLYETLVFPRRSQPYGLAGGRLFKLDNDFNPIQEIKVAGKVLDISLDFYRTRIYAIVSPNNPQAGKPTKKQAISKAWKKFRHNRQQTNASLSYFGGAYQFYYM